MSHEDLDVCRMLVPFSPIVYHSKDSIIARLDYMVFGAFTATISEPHTKRIIMHTLGRSPPVSLRSDSGPYLAQTLTME